MSSTPRFTKKEIHRLDQLELLMKHPILSLGRRNQALSQALTPALPRRLWAELLWRVEQQESTRLLTIHKELHLKHALVRGKAWKNPDGRLDYTWPGAKDGKIATKGAVPILFMVDLTTSQLQPHHELMVLAECMLEVNSLRNIRSYSDIFQHHLDEWRLLAEKNLARVRGSPSLLEELERINDLENVHGRTVGNDLAKKIFIVGAVKGATRRKNDPAHDLATDLWVICNDIRKAMHAPQHDLEDRFWLTHQSLEAARLADRLKLVASKGNAQRIMKMLEKKGRKEGPFAEAVRTACEVCWDMEPGIRPSGKAVLAAMRSRIVEKNGVQYVAPRKSTKVDWEKSPLASFQKIMGTWARGKGLKMSGSMRPQKGQELPKPEPE